MCGFVIGASFNSFVSFFNENIKKSQRVVQLYFLGKLNLLCTLLRLLRNTSIEEVLVKVAKQSST